MEAIAKGKFLRGSPQKARLVIDLIRGQNVPKALAILQFTNKRATDNIEKCLRSAIANATFKAEQDNVAIDPDDLWVKTCFVDMGPHKNRRRVRPAPQGRAYREQRYYCHITIEVTSEQPENAKKNGKGKKAVNFDKPRAAKAQTAEAIDVAPAATTEEAVENISTAPTVTIEEMTTTVQETATTVEETPKANETEATAEEQKTE